MAELLSNAPVFTIVMGCDGAGKSAWKRANYDRLPEYYFDRDSIAGGFGDWNNERNRDRTRILVDEKINEYIEKRFDFGIESTFSGLPSVELLNRAFESGYIARGFYIGTNSPDINTARIEYRVLHNQGHEVDLQRVPNRHAYSLSNLHRHFDRFDELELIDNSEEDDLDHEPLPVLQGEVVKGIIRECVSRKDMADWCRTLLERIERSRANQAEREKKLTERKSRREKSRGR